MTVDALIQTLLACNGDSEVIIRVSDTAGHSEVTLTDSMVWASSDGKQVILDPDLEN